MPEPLALAVGALRGVAPELDATGLAEALWLASLMAEPSGTADGSARSPSTTGQDQELERRSPPPRPERHGGSGTERANPSELALHERLSGSTARVRGEVVDLPGAAALPLALELARALRPWKRPWRGGRHQALDIEATAQDYARSGELIPVFTTAPERWFDLVVVVDRSPSMLVWRETIDAFTAVLDQLGAFRTLQIRDLTLDADGEATLRDGQGRAGNPGQLRSPTGRRLVLVVSDCAPRAWRAPEIWRQLRAWSRTTPVALLNPLPVKLWRSAGLDLPTVRVRPGRPGAANNELSFTRPTMLSPNGADEWEGWMPLPVLSLTPHSLARWSDTVMRGDPGGCGAVLVPPDGHPVSRRRARSSPRGPEERARGFLRTASPPAIRLAVLCSPFDQLSLALLHLIRQEIVPEATTSDMAELLTAGILPLRTDPEGVAVLTVPAPVQALLGDELRDHERHRVRRTLAGLRIARAAGGRGPTAVVSGGRATDEVLAEPTPFGYVLAGAAPAPPTESVSATAARLAMTLLPWDGPRWPRPGDLVSAVDTTLELLADQDLGTDRAALLRELESLVNVWQAPAEGEADRASHFWSQYKRYLTEDQRVAAPVVLRIDEDTRDVLAQLEDPWRLGRWRRGGRLVSHPRLDRTAHAIGLMAKAIDAGYRLVVLIAGTTDGERSEVQQRVDRGLLGFDTRFRPRAPRDGEDAAHRRGVGSAPHAERLDIVAMTSSGEGGDFSPEHARRLPFLVGTLPHVFVVKRNSRVLDSLGKWLADLPGTGAAGVTRDLPLLVVDHDVDATSTRFLSASGGGPSTPWAASVRALVDRFERSVYLGYGESPVGGLPTGFELRGNGFLLSPDTFRHTLRVPSSDATSPAGSSDPLREPLPPRSESSFHPVTDHEEWMPARHPAAHVPSSELPPSLCSAIDAFVLACAARRAHGDFSETCSMLVSVSRHPRVQAHVRDWVDSRVRGIEDTLGAGGPEAERRMAAFESAWATHLSPAEPGELSWRDVAPHVRWAVASIRVRTFDGEPRDMTAFSERAPGSRNTIAVTVALSTASLPIDGPTVAYVLGSPRDSLFPPRWLGEFRGGRNGIRRLYTTPDNHEKWGRPGRVGPPATSGRSGPVVETPRFSLSPEVLRNNFQTLERMVASLDRIAPGSVHPLDRTVLWEGVPMDQVTGFLDAYQLSQDGRPGVDADARARAAAGGPDGWNVCLMSRGHAPQRAAVAQHLIGLVQRSPLDEPGADVDELVRRLVAPEDERADPAAGREGGAVHRRDRPLLLLYLLRQPLGADAGSPTPIVGFFMRFPPSDAGPLAGDR
ncbi:Z1 domain-containing protein [Streptomyces profundus]|uniref:Z1 domain-containing protein n=1 Tax=Streptomyces profundus TaxID=2867410 RepID=UPI001D15F460|nr:Z1 domain-containing protein [Streptomyces sp. MA3_2.13]UED86769.1 Z1 domain-containing protein [Streptomyces sp. MA3_2.13]